MLNKKVDSLQGDFFVVKDHFLNEVFLDPYMKPLEYKIITVGLSKLTPVTESLTVRFSIADFCNFVGIKKDGMFHHLKKIVNGLTRGIFIIDESGKYSAKSWFDEISYDKGEGFVTMIFNEKLHEHVFRLKKKDGTYIPFTRYHVKNIIFMKSIFSMKTYELLKQYEVAKSRTFEINDFRKKIGAIKKSHMKMNMFRKDVLKKVVNEINLLSDIYVSYEEKKEGKYVTGLIFRIQPNYFKGCGTFDVVSKDKIILRIQNQVIQKTGIIFDAKHMNNVHRKILMELIENFDRGRYDTILIQYPEYFFINELKTIMEKYDMEAFYKKFEDF